MALPRFHRLTRNRLALVGIAVALPALLLAALGVQLTIRVVAGVRAESARYNTYIADKVTEAFEQELLEQVREAVVPAEQAARTGGGEAAIVAGLSSRARDFEAPHFVPVEELTGYSLIMVESQLLVYGNDPTGHRPHPFAAVLLRGPTGEVVGAGGWWFNPRAFLVTYLAQIVQTRLTSNPRLYGGIESMRNLAIQLFDVERHEVARMREPGDPATARLAAMTGPFEGFRVRVSSTAKSPVALAGRFFALELALIALTAFAILVATFFGLRYTLRQIELVQVKSSFVSNVTHELKTPIAVIRLAVETLEMRRFRTPEEGDKYLRTILKETAKLSQLVDNILDFSRLESGRRVFRFSPVVLADVVEAAMESFRLRFEDEGFQVTVHVPDDLPPARGDAMAIQHCLLNLLDNAVKYSPQRKDIRVFAGAHDGMVTLAVADRGIGIDPAQRERIFEKFVRVETGLVHDVKGAGLGLSLVDQIIRAHHGRVDVVSTPGEGSTFTLVLPAWEAGREAPRDAAREAMGA